MNCGKFVEIRFAQNTADCSTSRIVGGGPSGVAIFLAGHLHRAEFEHAEDAAVQADTLLNEENRTGATQFDG